MAGFIFANGLTRDSGAEFKQSRLARLLGDAQNAQGPDRQALLNRAAYLDPGKAQQAQSNFASLDADRMKSLGQKAAMVVAAARGGNSQMAAAMYPQLVQEASAVFGPNSLKPEWDDSQLAPLEAFANAATGAKPAEQFTLSPGSARYGADGRLIVEQPFAPKAEAWSVVNVPDGQGGQMQMEHNAATGEWRQPSYGGQAPRPMAPQMPTDSGVPVSAGPALDPTQDYPRLASRFGAQTSSTYRDPRHNAAVGGVPNSQHMRGTAGDFVVPQAQRAAFKAAAQRAGYEVIDEGDHVHLELPPGRQAAGRFGPQSGPRLGYTPPKAAAGDKPPAGYRFTASGNLEAIPGGPAEVAAQARAAAQKAAADAADLKRQAAGSRQAEAAGAADQLVRAIDTLTASPGFPALGTAWGDVQLHTPMIRNGAKDSQAQLKNIAGQVALATMARLKALSAQGATGFGALSQQELRLLENSIATLQSEDISNAQLKASLKTIRDTMTKVSGFQGGNGDRPRSTAVGKYRVGQVIEHGGKKYRVTGGDMNDPDVEEVR